MYYKKRSQVTIFMVIGVVMLFIFLLLFYIDSISERSIEEFGTKDLSVRNYVQNCLEAVGDKALEWVLLQGGTYEAEVNKTSIRIHKLTRKIQEREGIERGPYEFSKENVDVGIKSFFMENYFYCIDDFRSFDIPIEYTPKARFNLTIGEKATIMDLDFPIVVREGGKELFFERFRYRKSIDLDKIVDTVNQVVDESVELNDVPADLLSSLPSQGVSFDLTVLYVGNFTEDVAYWLDFENGKSSVVFVIHYDWLSSRDISVTIEDVGRYADETQAAADAEDESGTKEGLRKTEEATEEAEKNYADIAESYAIRARIEANRANEIVKDIEAIVGRIEAIEKRVEAVIDSFED